VRPTAEAGLAGAAAEVPTGCRVHALGDPLLEVLEDPVALGVGQPSALDGLGEFCLRGRDERVHERGDGLALGLRDLRERLPVPELLSQLRLGEAEEGRRRVQPRTGAVAVVPEAEPAAA
jgi:hypothetical protein